MTNPGRASSFPLGVDAENAREACDRASAILGSALEDLEVRAWRAFVSLGGTALRDGWRFAVNGTAERDVKALLDASEPVFWSSLAEALAVDS